MTEWGRCLGYTNTQCPNCGRYRVELFENNKRVCEKCSWCIEEDRYIDRDEIYGAVEYNTILLGLDEQRGECYNGN